MNKFSNIIFFIVLSISFSNAKETVYKLPWMHYNLPTTKDISYKVTQGESSSLQEAKTDALHQLLFELSASRGVNITSDVFTSIEEQVNNTKTNMSSSFRKEIKISNSGFDASFAKIDEVIKQKNGRFTCWQVYAIGDFSITPIPEFRYTTDYGIKPIVYSTLVPGWGQIHKGQLNKGFIFTGTEMTFIGASVYFNSKYNFNMNRSQETAILDIKKEYVERADNYAKYRNVTTAFASAVWIWNIIDAVSSEGMAMYVSNNRISFKNPDPNMTLLSYTINF